MVPPARRALGPGAAWRRPLLVLVMVLQTVHIQLGAAAGCGRPARPSWRADGRCGPRYPLASGAASTCDRAGERPCCSDFGYCGGSDGHCRCDGCVDFRTLPGDEGCVLRFAGVEGVMETQDFPAAYPANVQCCYDVQRPDPSYCGIQLQFERFELRGSMEPFCQQDWLAADYCVPEKGARLCGNLTGTSHEFLYQPGATALRFAFRSDAGGGADPGFRIRYRQLRNCRDPYADPEASEIPGADGVQCYTRVTNDRGSINSPFWPNPYPNGVECVYEFDRVEERVCGVAMQSLQFELQPPFESPLGGACADFFHCPSCGYLCGSVDFSWIARFQPGATSLKFHFHADETDAYRGFQVNFTRLYQCD